MNKPLIPSIEDKESVIEWFFKYDDKLKIIFSNIPPFILNLEKQLREEMLANLNQYNDAKSLQGFVKKIADFHSMFLIEFVAIKEAISNGKIQEKDVAQQIYMDISMTTKMRVLGYFLLKKYGIQAV